MTDRAYPEYLRAVTTLVEQDGVLAASLAATERLGQAELFGAARRVREVEDQGRSLSQRVRAADESLARLTRDLGLELDAVSPRQPPPTALADVDRRLGELQRELTAIERNGDWVRRNRAVQARSVSAATTVAVPAEASPPVAAPPPTPPAKRAWNSPLVWIVGVLAVLVVVVVILIVK